MSERLDRAIVSFESALRTVFAAPSASRPSPASNTPEASLSPEDRKTAGALMRVNHVGEVCAQAMYDAQAISTGDARLRLHFQEAAREEADHLAWTRQRLDALGARPSALNPVWYAGAFVFGLVAGRAGDAASLGFVAETERQVEAHLDGHLERLPASDVASRQVVEQMKADEAQHAAHALAAGARELPGPVKSMMQLAARVMTTVAHRI